MKKLTFALLAVTAMTLVGCGGSSSSATTFVETPAGTIVG